LHIHLHRFYKDILNFGGVPIKPRTMPSKTIQEKPALDTYYSSSSEHINLSPLLSSKDAKQQHQEDDKDKKKSNKLKIGIICGIICIIGVSVAAYMVLTKTNDSDDTTVVVPTQPVTNEEETKDGLKVAGSHSHKNHEHHHDEDKEKADETITEDDYWPDDSDLDDDGFVYDVTTSSPITLSQTTEEVTEATTTNELTTTTTEIISNDCEIKTETGEKCAFPFTAYGYNYTDTCVKHISWNTYYWCYTDENKNYVVCDEPCV